MGEIVLIAILFAVDLQNIEDRFVLKEVVPRQSLRFSESNVFLEGRIVFSPTYVGEAKREIANQILADELKGERFHIPFIKANVVAASAKIRRELHKSHRRVLILVVRLD